MCGILGNGLQAVEPGCYRSPFCPAPAPLCPHRWDRCLCSYVKTHTWEAGLGLAFRTALNLSSWAQDMQFTLSGMPSPRAAGWCVPGALYIAWQLKGWSFAWFCLAECDCVHGECSSGVAGNGSCTCYGGYTGPRCDQGKHSGSCTGAGTADMIWAWVSPNGQGGTE